MIRATRFAAVGMAAIAMLSTAAFPAFAQGGRVTAKCPPAAAHNLPKGSGSTSVISFGVKGGSLRPWSATLALGGSITATGTTATRQQLSDPKNTLKALLTLADAEGFFSLKKTVGCVASAGNPDTSSRFITIHTSSGSKTVNELGSCTATSKYDQLYDVLEGAAGIGG